MERANKMVRPWQRETRPAEPHSNRERQDFYHTNRWRVISQGYRKDHPLCEECKKNGLTVPSEVTDHIKPINQGGNPYDRDNFQALCSKCHARKSAREKGRER